MNAANGSIIRFAASALSSGDFLSGRQAAQPLVRCREHGVAERRRKWRHARLANPAGVRSRRRVDDVHVVTFFG